MKLIEDGLITAYKAGKKHGMSTGFCIGVGTMCAIRLIVFILFHGKA